MMEITERRYCVGVSFVRAEDRRDVIGVERTEPNSDGCHWRYNDVNKGPRTGRNTGCGCREMPESEMDRAGYTGAE